MNVFSVIIISSVVYFLLTLFVLILAAKLKHKTTMPSAQEALEQFITDIRESITGIIVRIDNLINGSGDLTREEVIELMTPIKEDLANIANPPEQTDEPVPSAPEN